MNSTVLGLGYFVTVPLFLNFIQVILQDPRKAESQTFRMKFTSQIKYVVVNHVFKNVYPPIRSVSPQERPPRLYALVG